MSLLLISYVMLKFAICAASRPLTSAQAGLNSPIHCSKLRLPTLVHFTVRSS